MININIYKENNIDFLKKINSHTKLTLYCCSCPHHNGECVNFARAGTCRAFNKYKNQNKKDLFK